MAEPAPGFATTGVPRGLANISASCYINGALQVIAMRPRLRALAVDGLPEDHPLPRFFSAYDDADNETLAQRHAEVIRYIRLLRPRTFASGRTGSSGEVLAALRVPSIDVLGELDTVHRAVAAGDREFQLGSDANANNMRHDALGAAGDLHAFLYFTGDHYVAFGRSGGQWYRLDDQQVTAVGVADLQALPVQVGHDAQGYPIAQACKGIVFVSYADPLP